MTTSASEERFNKVKGISGMSIVCMKKKTLGSFEYTQCLFRAFIRFLKSGSC